LPPALDAAISAAADEQLSLTRDRIHVRGIASDGTDIGQYSSTPIYVNPQNSPSAFQPMGKTGRTVFASTGQQHVTRYFDQGYREFRQAAGLSADKVVLTLRGDLRDQLTVIKTSNGYSLGWTDESLYDLSQMLEKKYAKPIWTPTAGERYLAVEGIRAKVGATIR
jgi:hypothetical protein